jgi:hypothetical protein
VVCSEPSIFSTNMRAATLGRWNMAGLSITGQMKVSTLQEGFLKEFGLTLRVYDGRSLADPTQRLAQVRKKKGSGKDLSVAKNMKVGNLEDKFEEEFGLKVQVAGSDDSYLCKDELTLNTAQQEDEKKLVRKERKAVRQDEAGNDGVDKESKKTPRISIEMTAENKNESDVDTIEGSSILETSVDGSENPTVIEKDDEALEENLIFQEIDLAEVATKSGDKEILETNNDIKIQEFNLVTGDKETSTNDSVDKDPVTDELVRQSTNPNSSSIREVDLLSINQNTKKNVTMKPTEEKTSIQEYDLTK